MAKIGIISMQRVMNHGSFLQAYALKEVLKEMDTNPSFINYQDKHILKDYKLIRINSLKSFFSSIEKI